MTCCASMGKARWGNRPIRSLTSRRRSARLASVRIAFILGLGAISMSASLAAQQAADRQIARNQGARVGVRNENADVPGSSQDLRVTKRLPTRINSRIATRLERYSDPDRALWAYETVPDDGSRRSLIGPRSSTTQPQPVTTDGMDEP